MKIEISTEELRKRKLFVATPMYGGQCFGTYTQSMVNLAVACASYGIQMRLYYIFNESLITRGRSYSCDEFLRSDCTHMLFIDSDIGFEPDHVLSLLALQSDESPYDVITASYPKKTISWEKIKHAVDKGVADENPNELSNYVGDFVFNLPPGTHQFKLDEPFEVMEAGTGFMMIRRKTLEDFQKAYPEKMFKPDHVRTDAFDGSREICMFFDCVIDPESKRYLSEDYAFCQYVRKMGGHVYMCGWMNLTHSGTTTYSGTLGHLASVGANLTADANQLKKNTQPIKKRNNIQPMGK